MNMALKRILICTMMISYLFQPHEANAWWWSKDKDEEKPTEKKSVSCQLVYEDLYPEDAALCNSDEYTITVDCVSGNCSDMVV